MDNELEQQSSKIAIFKGKQIRKTIYQGEWYFSIIDVVAVLTESQNPRRYWSDLKIQLSENEGFIQLYEKTVQLKLLPPPMEKCAKRTRRIQRPFFGSSNPFPLPKQNPSSDGSLLARISSLLFSLEKVQDP